MSRNFRNSDECSLIKEKIRSNMQMIKTSRKLKLDLVRLTAPFYHASLNKIFIVLWLIYIAGDGLGYGLGFTFQT